MQPPGLVSRPSCENCHRVLRTWKPGKRYCSSACRKQAWTLRQGQERQPPGESPTSRAEALLTTLNAYRARIGAGALTPSAYLTAGAEVKEAEEQVALWASRLRERRQRLAALERDAGHFVVKVQAVRPAGLLVHPSAEDDQIGIAAQTPDLSIVITGRLRDIS